MTVNEFEETLKMMEALICLFPEKKKVINIVNVTLNLCTNEFEELTVIERAREAVV